MQEEKVRRSSVKQITKTVLAFKAARLSRGFNRRQASETIGFLANLKNHAF